MPLVVGELLDEVLDLVSTATGQALAIAKFDPGIYSIVRSFSPDE